MTFLARILSQLADRPDRPALHEVNDGSLVTATGEGLLARVTSARAFVRSRGLKAGDRCALLAPNSIDWVAADLALMAEGVVVVPFYTRQPAPDIAAMIRDAGPSLVLCADDESRHALGREEGVPDPIALSALFEGPSRAGAAVPPVPAADDPVTIIYTSGTSGRQKGVVLTVANLDHVLRATVGALDDVVGEARDEERALHYLPLCYAGSWVLLLTSLMRGCRLHLNTELTRLAADLRVVDPHYYLNVPIVLERMRDSIEGGLQRRGGALATLFRIGSDAWRRRSAGTPALFDGVRLAVARSFLFSPLRKRLAPSLETMICGSAPLSRETQSFYEMLGIPVLQVYGLTETTAICTMDEKGRVEAGRVGRAIDGAEMRLGERDEILVRGPNVFAGYWRLPAETEAAFADGWFRTGDCGEVDDTGNWKITGRLKSVIVLASGHNVAPEPLEDKLQSLLPEGNRVMIVGHGRPHLTALFTGSAAREGVSNVIDRHNADVPHYQRISRFALDPEPFTIENGLLTANGKVRRNAVLVRYEREIDALYEKENA